MKPLNAIAVIGVCASSLLIGCTTEMREEILYGKSTKQMQSEKPNAMAMEKKQAVIQDMQANGDAERQTKAERRLTEFLGVEFGKVVDVSIGAEIHDGMRGAYILVPFVPKKPLPGFDVYELGVTVKGHKVYMIRAGRKNEKANFPQWEQIKNGLEMRYGQSMHRHQDEMGAYSMDFNGKQEIYFDTSIYPHTKKYGQTTYEYFGRYYGDARLMAIDYTYLTEAANELKALTDAKKQVEADAKKKEAEKVKDLF